MDGQGAVRGWAGSEHGARTTRYLPYGEEELPTGDDTAKFGAYTRDSVTGLDYAKNRYYSSALGRFITPDPYEGSARAATPGSWNRCGFVLGDPANRVDPLGLDDVDAYGCAANTALLIAGIFDPEIAIWDIPLMTDTAVNVSNNCFGTSYSNLGGLVGTVAGVGAPEGSAIDDLVTTVGDGAACAAGSDNSCASFIVDVTTVVESNDDPSTSENACPPNVDICATIIGSGGGADYSIDVSDSASNVPYDPSDYDYELYGQ